MINIFHDYFNLEFSYNNFHILISYTDTDERIIIIDFLYHILILNFHIWHINYFYIFNVYKLITIILK